MMLGVTIKGSTDTSSQAGYTIAYWKAEMSKPVYAQEREKERRQEEKENIFTLSLVGVAIHRFFSRAVNKQLLPYQTIFKLHTQRFAHWGKRQGHTHTSHLGEQ